MSARADAVTAPIRVARIITRLNVGGPARQAILLADRLRARGYETLLLAGMSGPREGSLEDLARQRGVEPVLVPGLGRAVRPFAEARAFAEILRRLRSFRPHIVHTHMAKAGALGRLAGAMAGARLVHTFHGNVFRGYFGRGGTLAIRAAEAVLARAATDVAIAISPSQARELRRLASVPRRRIRVLPLGLDLDPFFGVARGSAFRHGLGVPDGAPLVGLVGRLVPIKRPDLFLDAAVALRALDPRTHAVIVGDGPSRDAVLARVRREGLAPWVHLTGFRVDLPEVLAGLDALLLTSRNEGTPAAVIEAMAAGVPVVAVPVGGVRDLTAGSALLVPPDARAIARETLALLRAPDRALHLAAAARARARDFSIERLVGDVDRLYRDLLSRRAPRPET